LGPETRVLPFHLVREGEFTLRRASGPPERIAADEVVICTQGDEHLMSAGRAKKPTPFARIYAGERPAMSARVERSELGPETRLLCGVFLLNSAPLNPLLASLPPLLKIRTASVPESPMLMRAVEMLAFEVDRGAR